jgi:hypothetical protein
MGIGAVGGMIGAILLNREASKEYKTSYKRSVVEPVLEYLRLEATYYPESYVAEHDVERCSLFQDRIDRINGSDYVEGTLNGAEFYYSEIKLQQKKRSNSNSNASDYRDLFNGLFYVAEYEHEFSGNTVLFPQKSWDILNVGLSSDKSSNMELIKNTILDLKFPSWSPKRANFDEQPSEITIPDMELADLFNFYGTDLREAQQLISSDIWSTIKAYVQDEQMDIQSDVQQKLAEKMGIQHVDDDALTSIRIPKISLSLRLNKLFISQPLSSDLFEPQIWKTSFKVGEMVVYFRFLRFALGLTRAIQPHPEN